MTEYEKELDDIAGYVRHQFQVYYNPTLLYHNIGHTEMVVERSREIAAHYSLSPESFFVLIAAAWFHDTGHLLHAAEDHEMVSIIVMRDYFSNKSISGEILMAIETCIQATRIAASPSNLLGEILCDADLFHLGTTHFLQANEAVRNELQLREHAHFENWYQLSLCFLESHHYYTGYCQQLLNAGKHENMIELKKLIANA